MKDKFEKLAEGFKGLKDQAQKISKQGSKTAETVKGAVKVGVETSKAAYSTGKTLVEKVANKEALQQGLDVTSKGAELAAKGAKMASKGAEFAGEALEKASESLQSAKDKLK